MPKMNPRKRKEKGQSMVEFAISAMVMIFLLAAVVDFGRAFFTYVAMRDAAQEAAVYGSICPLNKSTIEMRARSSSVGPINLMDYMDEITINCTYTGSGDACGTPGVTPAVGYGIQVEVLYPDFPLTVPVLTNIIGDHLSLRAVVTDTILRNSDCSTHY